MERSWSKQIEKQPEDKSVEFHWRGRNACLLRNRQKGGVQKFRGQILGTEPRFIFLEKANADKTEKTGYRTRQSNAYV
jgi:hypothetical protein